MFKNGNDAAIIEKAAVTFPKQPEKRTSWRDVFEFFFLAMIREVGIVDVLTEE